MLASAIGGGIRFGGDYNYWRIAKEAITQVPVSGEKAFTLTVNVVYKDGKLVTLEPVKGSVTPVSSDDVKK